MSTRPASLQLSRQGEYAVLCDPNPSGELTLALQQRLWAFAQRIEQEPDVHEAVLGMNNILLILHVPVRDLGPLQTRLAELWHGVTPATETGRLIEVPVRYGGAQGADLAWVAHATGLSVAEYVARHAGAAYAVYALGSHPGFAYLGGLPTELAVPRRASPRPSVAASTIMVGGAQAGIQARTTPSGWHMIGMSDVQCFDPQAQPPVLFAPGDQVRFVVEQVLPCA